MINGYPIWQYAVAVLVAVVIFIAFVRFVRNREMLKQDVREIVNVDE